MGEGGGQILRSSLTLALCLDRPFHISNIRSARKIPGLRRQHQAAVEAAAAIANARVSGAVLGSRQLSFIPGPPRPGLYRFSIGTAGSTTLVLQTVLPALLACHEPSELRVEGGTHNPLAPPYDFFARAFLPLVRRLGGAVSARLERPGFYPAGGGLVSVRIEPPAGPPRPFSLLERGAVRAVRCDALVANLPGHIAHRELGVIGRELGLDPGCLHADELRIEKGCVNLLRVTVGSDHVTEVFTGFGRRGLRAETLASRLADEVRRYLAADVPVGEYLADQLLLPLALAGGGVFRTLRPSPHTLTNIQVLQRFLDVPVICEQRAEDDWLVSIGP